MHVCVSERIYEPVFSPCGSSLHHCRSCFSLLFLLCCCVRTYLYNETYRKLPGSGHLWLVVDRLPGSCFGRSKQTLVLVLVGILIITTRTCNGVDIAFSPTRNRCRANGEREYTHPHTNGPYAHMNTHTYANNHTRVE